MCNSGVFHFMRHVTQTMSHFTSWRCRCTSEVNTDIFQLISDISDGLIPGPDKNCLSAEPQQRGPEENPDKTPKKLKTPKTRPDKNSRLGPLQDQGSQGIIGGPVVACFQKELLSIKRSKPSFPKQDLKSKLIKFGKLHI